MSAKTEDDVELRRGRRALQYTQVHDWVTLSGISPTARFLYVLLRMHVNRIADDGMVRTSSLALAVMVNLSRGDKIKKYVDELVRIGAVTVHRGGMHRCNNYEVHETPPRGYAAPTDIQAWYDRHRALIALKREEEKRVRDERRARNRTGGDQAAPLDDDSPEPRDLQDDHPPDWATEAVTPVWGGQPVTPVRGEQAAPERGEHVTLERGREPDEGEPDEGEPPPSPPPARQPAPGQLPAADASGRGVGYERQDAEPDGQPPPRHTSGWATTGRTDPDSVLTSATAGLPARLRLSPHQRGTLLPMVAAALAAGWTPDALTRHLRTDLGTATTLYGVLRHRLTPGKGLGEPPAPTLATPPTELRTWCGRDDCDPTTRQRLTTTGNPQFRLDHTGARVPVICDRCTNATAVAPRRDERLSA